MGVHGLTSYLRENQRVLSKPLQFDSSSSDGITNLVVDGWSFIYELVYCSKLDWVYGGEYGRFYDLVISVVNSWVSVGLKLYFVFDGPYPPIKFDTVVSRLTETNVRCSLLFFRTSASSRSTSRFLNESRILSPLSFSACIQALKSVSSSTRSVEIHFAPEEGDPYAVELAGKLNGYVTGHDSDFVVLNTDGYKGYIPMDDFFWSSSVDRSESTSQAADEDSEFQPVRRRKKAKKQMSESKGIIPPEGTSELALSCSFYSPTDLAARLEIPVSLLPLVGALVGNDFSTLNRGSRAMFFDRTLPLTKRITHVASTLRAVLTAPSGPKRKQKQIGSVIELIRRTVLALFIRDVSHMPSGEQEAIVEEVVESTLQYAIPKREPSTSESFGPACLQHDSPNQPMILSRPDLPNNWIVIRDLYNNAYRRGDLDPNLIDILHSSTFWPRLFLENPDAESVVKSIGGPIREWIYAILDDGVGIPEMVEPEPSEPSEPEEAEEDEDELVDVEEENSSDDELVDPLAPLRGALERLEGEPRLQVAELPPIDLSIERKPRFVDEYVRKGTRIAPEEIRVADLSIILSDLPMQFATPVQLTPEHTRFRLLVTILSSDKIMDQMHALPRDQVIPVLATRLILKALSDRCVQSPNNKEHLKEKWAKREVKALLLAFVGPSIQMGEEEPSLPEIHDRHVQLTAQILTALESVIFLAQVLLLNNNCLPLTLVNRFSGKRFHEYLNHSSEGSAGDSSFVEQTVSSELWNSVVAEFDDNVFREDWGKKARKERKEAKRREQKPVINKARSTGKVNGGMFGLLADAEA